LKKLTSEDGGVAIFNWCPDGRSIAYTTTWAGITKIFIINVDSKIKQKVFESRQMERSRGVYWTCDGKRLIFKTITILKESYKLPPGQYCDQIFTMGTDGKRLKQLTSGIWKHNNIIDSTQ
jgi:Tol biopolymer transport system component